MATVNTAFILLLNGTPLQTFNLDVREIWVNAESNVARQSPRSGGPRDHADVRTVHQRKRNYHCINASTVRK